MWVLKTRGESYYVNHVTCSVPWSTKETPGNDHTKGSIKVKRCALTIDEHNHATISALTDEQLQQLHTPTSPWVRVITKSGAALEASLAQLDMQHGIVRKFTAACSSPIWITDILRNELSMLLLAMGNSDLRVLMPNELYHRWYDRTTGDTVDLDLLEEMEYEDLYEN